MAFGATKIVPAQMMPGDRERIMRTMRVLEQDIARLEKQLAERRSPEGQEATRATILSKRAQLHRLNDYLKVAMPHRVQPRYRPIPSTHQNAEVAPKGSVQHKQRMEAARKQLQQTPPPPPRALPKPDVKPLPEVVDEASLAKYQETLEANKKALHEMKMQLDAMERHKHIDNKPAVVETPAPPALSPTEKAELVELPKQLKHLNDRLVIVKKNVKRANDDGYMRMKLSQFQRTRNRATATHWPRRGLSLKIWMEMKPTPQRTTLRRGSRSYPAQKLTHPDLEIIPQRMQSIRNRLDFLNRKKAGVADRKPVRVEAKDSARSRKRQRGDGLPAGTINLLNNEYKEFESEMLNASNNDDIVVAMLAELVAYIKTNKINRSSAEKDGKLNQMIENIQGRVFEVMKASQGTQGITNLGGHAHRPYAMPRNLGMLTVLKHRAVQRANPTAVESNNMAGLRRYTAAQHARDARARAEEEQKKEVANLAGAFSQTRAVMERMVR